MSEPGSVVRLALSISLVLFATAMATPAAYAAGLQATNDGTPRVEVFRASNSEIVEGESTTLVWSTEGYSGVWLEGQRVGADGRREVRPSESRVYTLRVRRPDGYARDVRTVVTVRPAAERGQVTTAPVATAVFVGEWDTNFGKLRLHQFDGYVVGDYADRGVLLGRVNGNCVAGVFTNEGRAGIFRWQSSGTGSFGGQWAWHGDPLGGSWQGNRISGGVGDFRNFSRDGSQTRIRVNDREVWDGDYSTSHGSIRLRARDLFLIGDYADRGILAGMWDGNNFVGRFTNGNRVGWFRFPSNSASGSFGQGRWGWVEGDGGGSWNLRKRGDRTPTLTNMIDDVRCE